MEKLEECKNAAFREITPAQKGSPFYRGKGYYIPKRVVDVFCSCIALICLSPVFLITAIAIKAESAGPVFFFQDRVGKNKRVFKMYKFRSMRTDAPELHQRLKEEYGDTSGSFKIKDDPRITKVGKVIRKLSIDEYIGTHAAENQETMAANLAMLKLKPNEIYFITKDYYINYIKEYLLKYQQLKMLEKLEKKHSSDVVMNISQTDLMTGNDFEYFVADILNKIGYKAQVTKATGDQGLDIIAVKGTFRLGVQTKRWSGSVGNKAIQETVAGKAYYNVDQVLVVTNSYFTNEAIALARANNVMLWDRHDLEEKMKSL